MIKIFVFFIVFLTTFHASAETVAINGAVAKPGNIPWQADLRLRQAIGQAGDLTEKTFWSGAAWFSEENKRSQETLQRYLLETSALLALSAPKKAQRDFFKQKNRYLQKLSPTGRKIAVLEPVRLEQNPRQNFRLQAGDTIFFPERLDKVLVTGAVANDCWLDLQALKDVLWYARQCPLQAFADQDFFYLILPNGEITTVPVAAWNRQDPVLVPPNALLFIPIQAKTLAKTAPDFNSIFVEFLSTWPTVWLFEKRETHAP